MENIEIKNKNIFLNLNEDEEIVYVAEKASKFEFYFFSIPSILVIAFLLTFLSLFVILTLYKAYNQNYFYILFLVILLLFMVLMLYKEIVDYCFTDIVLTNQRLIISKLNKILSIPHNQIKYIQNAGTGRGPSATRINLINKKFHIFYFLNHLPLRNKFKEVCPDYDDSQVVEKERKQGTIILAILLLLLPFFMYAEYKLKLSDNQNKSYKSAKHQHNSKEPYFDTYMTNLQDKIKGNWNPPKAKDSNNVVLLFKVDRNGNVLKAKVLKSSNNTAVDKSALEALRKSEPLEPLPKEFKGKNVDVQFNFDYNVLSRKSKL